MERLIHDYRLKHFGETFRHCSYERISFGVLYLPFGFIVVFEGKFQQGHRLHQSKPWFTYLESGLKSTNVLYFLIFLFLGCICIRSLLLYRNRRTRGKSICSSIIYTMHVFNPFNLKQDIPLSYELLIQILYEANKIIDKEFIFIFSQAFNICRYLKDSKS